MGKNSVRGILKRSPSLQPRGKRYDLRWGRLSREWQKNRSFKLRRFKPSCDSAVNFLERGLRNMDSTYAKCRPERVPGVVLGQGTQGNDRRRHHEKGTRLRLIQGYIRRQP